MPQQVYATVAQFRNQIDRRALGNLGSDDRNESILGSSEIIADALKRASADIEAYALRGNRYLLEDLAALANVTAGTEDWTLIGLCCDLAAYYLVTRRLGHIPEAMKDRIGMARLLLMDLKNGEAVFNIEGNIVAGKADIRVLTPGQRNVLGMISDEPFFPPRRFRMV